MKVKELIDLLSDDAFDKDLELAVDNDNGGLDSITGVVQAGNLIFQRGGEIEE